MKKSSVVYGVIGALTLGVAVVFGTVLSGATRIENDNVSISIFKENREGFSTRPSEVMKMMKNTVLMDTDEIEYNEKTFSLIVKITDEGAKESLLYDSDNYAYETFKTEVKNYSESLYDFVNSMNCKDIKSVTVAYVDKYDKDVVLFAHDSKYGLIYSCRK